MAVQKITSNIISPGASGGATALDAVSGDGTGAMIVPKGTTAQRPATPVDGYIRYNTTVGALEQYVQSQSLWTNVGELAPTVSSISGTINADSDSTITITGTNFQSGAIVSITGSAVGGVERQLTTTFVSPTTLTAATNGAAVTYTGNASFNVKVTNPSGLNNSLSSAGTIDRDPSWSTSAGSLATIYDSSRSSYSSISVSATDPDGTSVTYSIVSGALPTGMSLNTSTGAITGTPNAVGSDTTSPFTIRATSNSFSADRAFSITVKAPVVVSFTSTGSSTFSVPTGLSSVRVLVVAGGGAGGGSDSNSAGGGGAGGMIEHPSFPVTPGGTVSYSVGAGAPTVVNSGGGAGSNSTFGTLTALGGGGGGAQNYPQTRGQPGGSGGGSSWEPPGNGTAQGMGIQTSSPAISADSRTYGYGYPGGIQVYDGGSAAATGGGGAGGAAGQINPGSQPHQASAGGPGRASTITGSPVYYAGGGGASGYYTQTNGGVGGGGNSVNNTNRNGSTNTGGGGGGCAIGGSNVGNTGGAGGPGIIIVRY